LSFDSWGKGQECHCRQNNLFHFLNTNLEWGQRREL
jgi:hypothetical protein